MKHTILYSIAIVLALSCQDGKDEKSTGVPEKEQPSPIPDIPSQLFIEKGKICLYPDIIENKKSNLLSSNHFTIPDTDDSSGQNFKTTAFDPETIAAERVENWISATKNNESVSFSFHNLPVNINRIQLFWLPYASQTAIETRDSFYSFNPKNQINFDLKHTFDLENQKSVLVMFHENLYEYKQINSEAKVYYAILKDI